MCQRLLRLTCLLAFFVAFGQARSEDPTAEPLEPYRQFAEKDIDSMNVAELRQALRQTMRAAKAVKQDRDQIRRELETLEKITPDNLQRLRDYRLRVREVSRDLEKAVQKTEDLFELLDEMLALDHYRPLSRNPDAILAFLAYDHDPLPSPIRIRLQIEDLQEAEQLLLEEAAGATGPIDPVTSPVWKKLMEMEFLGRQTIYRVEKRVEEVTALAATVPGGVPRQQPPKFADKIESTYRFLGKEVD